MDRPTGKSGSLWLRGARSAPAARRRGRRHVALRRRPAARWRRGAGPVFQAPRHVGGEPRRRVSVGRGFLSSGGAASEPQMAVGRQRDALGYGGLDVVPALRRGGAAVVRGEAARRKVGGRMRAQRPTEPTLTTPTTPRRESTTGQPIPPSIAWCSAMHTSAFSTRSSEVAPAEGHLESNS